MGTSLFSITNRLRKSLGSNCVYAIRCYWAERKQDRLHARLSPLGALKTIMPELDQWVDSGKKVCAGDLCYIIRDLRKRHRYRHALEATEWMFSKDVYKITPSEHALRLDLIGKVHGSESAETYFNSLEEKNQNEKTYGALLNSYAREKLTDKALSHMQKMKQLGFASTSVPYDNIMCLYSNTGQHEKVPEVFTQMKNYRVVPCNFSYRICINSYGERSDIRGMEKVLKEMKAQKHFTMDWNTYAAVANVYLKAGLTDKATATVEQTEKVLQKESQRDGYNRLISLYGSLGNKSAVNRIWELLKSSCKKIINKEYMTMLGSLVKLKELDEAESLLKDWDTCGNDFDFRVPNILLSAYCQQGMLQKAESMLEDYVKKGRVPKPYSYLVLAEAFEKNGETGKASEYRKKAEETNATVAEASA
ncbi:pentatricopeptide repeat-containing protein At4g21705, mitochondrial-like [Aristolochia californica]|uniref:pentatricopeptide repeat-containing protein At4g21705, mitochondrial-like n=1 Tax=Aristolochia californica TaxID=171875 RepID=UPI0035DE377F